MRIGLDSLAMRYRGSRTMSTALLLAGLSLLALGRLCPYV